MSKHAHACAVLSACVLTAMAQSTHAMDFGDTNGWHAVEAVAIDQPQINTIVYVGDNTQPATATVDVTDWDTFTSTTGQVFNITAYLDTGASGILLSTDTAKSLNIPISTTLYEDVGVAGTDSFGVSQDVRIGIANYLYTRNDLDLFNTNGTPNTTPYTTVKYPTTPNPLNEKVRLQIGPIPHQIQNPVVGSGSEDLQLLQALIDLLNGIGDTSQYRSTFDDVEQMIAQYNAVDVVGMPAMKGKVVVIDTTPVKGTTDFLNNMLTLENMPDIFLHTYVYDPGTPFNAAAKTTNPGIPTTSHHVKLSYASFDRFTRLTPSDAPGPTLSHNPFIGPDPVAAKFGGGASLAENTPGIKITRGTASSEGSWLLDTGAVASMISTAQAAKLHVFYKTGTFGTDAPVLVDDQGNVITDQFTLAISGIGGNGQTTLAGFFLDSLILRTMEGSLADDDPNNFRFFGAPVLVNDISLKDPSSGIILTLDGILGMNFLLPSTPIDMTDPLMGLAPINGYFDWVTFDEPNGILGLNLDSTLFDTVPEPASLTFLTAGALGLLCRRPRKSR